MSGRDYSSASAARGRVFLTLLECDRYTAGRLTRKDFSLEFEPLDQFHQRRKKLTEIEALGHPSYPHKFEWTHTAKQVAEKFGERTSEQLAAEHVDVRGAGGHGRAPPPRAGGFGT